MKTTFSYEAIGNFINLNNYNCKKSQPRNVILMK